ncbi:MAG: CHAT domain-containing protein [Syntrophaceae bacterium]|nr:CHAT domain-containing protein [Syntrophaceae bacterium]
MSGVSRLLCLVLFCLLAVFAPEAYGGDAERLVRRGDQAFNREDFSGALQFYGQATAQAAGQPALLSEIINNIAAVHMANRNLGAFQGSFARARELKQNLAHPAMTRSGASNLLTNGGFEDGLVFPWGTGHYERTDGKFKFGLWWNSMNANAFMKIDTAERHSGGKALRITSYSPSKPHVFTTVSQRIAGLKPNTVYKLSCWLKARDVPAGAALLAVDAAWAKRFALPPGTYDWRPFSVTVNIGHNDFVDFRIVYQSTGTIWIDDVAVEVLASPDEADVWQQAEGLFDAARYTEAMRLYEKLEAQHRDNKGMLRYIKWYTGRVQLLTGNYDQAFVNLNWAVDRGIGRAQIDLAELYYRLGDYPAAIRYYEKALDLVKGDQGTTSIVLHKLSQCHLAAGDRKEAARTEERAYFILKHIDDRHGQALSLNHLGVIAVLEKDDTRARSFFLQSIQLALRLDDRMLWSDIALNLADAAFRRRQYAECRTYLKEALPIKEAIGDQAGLVQALHLQGRTAVAENRPTEALPPYRRAVSVLESVAAGVGGISRESRSTFLQQFSRLYREYVDLLLQLYRDTGQPEYHREAFSAAEQARSRVFTEMMTESRAQQALIATAQDPEFTALLNKERLTNLEIAALERQIRQSKKSDGRQEMLTRLDQASRERKTVAEQITLRYPRYADLRTPGRLQIEDIQKQLGRNEAALSYFVTPTQTALWAVTRDRTVCMLIPISRTELIRKSESFRKIFARILETIGSPEPPGAKTLQSVFAFPAGEAHDLYGTLVAPVEDVIRSFQTVYLAPDDLLYKLPFEALLTRPFQPDKRNDPVIGASLKDAPFWLQSRDIVYLPSLSVLRSLRMFRKEAVAGQDPFVAFADPDFSRGGNDHGKTETPRKAVTRSALLRAVSIRPTGAQWLLQPLPETKEEALSVAAMLGASPDRDVYLRERASERSVKHLELSRYRNMLFATHGLMAGDFGPGTQPALALSFAGDPENDGLLEMGEILGLNLNADLVVLSACNTAAGNAGEDRGEGFAGLTRSFMYAGARSLLVTQWSVESRSAKMLVQKTFSRLGHSPKGEALALAKRDMVASDGSVSMSPSLSVSTAHPFFWAAYVLVGDAR